MAASRSHGCESPAAISYIAAASCSHLQIAGAGASQHGLASAPPGPGSIFFPSPGPKTGYSSPPRRSSAASQCAPALPDANTLVSRRPPPCHKDVKMTMALEIDAFLPSQCRREECSAVRDRGTIRPMHEAGPEVQPPPLKYLVGRRGRKCDTSGAPPRC